MAMFVYLRLMKSLVKSSSYGKCIKINIVVSLFLRCDLRGDLCHMYFMTHSVSVKIFLLFNSNFLTFQYPTCISNMFEDLQYIHKCRRDYVF